MLGGFLGACRLIAHLIQTTFMYFVQGPLRPTWNLRMSLEVEVIRHVLKNASAFRTEDHDDLDLVKTHVLRHIKSARSSIYKSRERMKHEIIEELVDEIPRLDRFLYDVRVHETELIHSLSKKGLDMDGKEYVSAEWSFPSTESQKYMLFLHGGAYVFMEPETHRNLTVTMANKLGVNVLAVDYRLAPEHPFPAGLFDAVSAFFYLMKKKGCKGSDILISGDSAGGGLCVALIHFLRLKRNEIAVALKMDADKILLPKGAILLSPWVDLTQSLPSWISKHEHDYLPISAIIKPSSLEETGAATLYVVGMDIVEILYDRNHDLLDAMCQELEQNIFLSPSLQQWPKSDLIMPPILIQCGAAEKLLSENIALFLRTMDLPDVIVREKVESTTHSLLNIPSTELLPKPSTRWCAETMSAALHSISHVKPTCSRLEVYEDMVHAFHGIKAFRKTSEVAFERMGAWVECLEKGIVESASGAYWLTSDRQ